MGLLGDTWKTGGEAAFWLLEPEPTKWRGKIVFAITDGLNYATLLNPKGGGLVEKFSGVFLYLKSSFLAKVYPVVGDTITVGPRTIEVAAVEGLLDLLDPFLTIHYEPVVKSS